MDLFEIINLPLIKKEYQIESYTLVDFTVGFDDLVYLLFSQNVPERINGMFCNTKANTRYVSFTIVLDWASQSVTKTIFRDFGVLEFNYHFIRPLKNYLMLVGSRCRYHDANNIEQNVLVLDDKGAIYKELCFGDGIEDCITTADGKIILSYFDEGTAGTYGWHTHRPIGSTGLLVQNLNGKNIWKNKTYPILDCYAINTDSSNRLWFYYYTDFHLVCTDFQTDIVMHPDISICRAFALSVDQQKILFGVVYYDSSFYQCSIDIKSRTFGEKRKVEIKLHNRDIERPKFHFTGSKLLFLVDDILCGYYFM